MSLRFRRSWFAWCLVVIVFLPSLALLAAGGRLAFFRFPKALSQTPRPVERSLEPPAERPASVATPTEEKKNKPHAAPGSPSDLGTIAIKKRVYCRIGINLRGKGKDLIQIQPGQLILKGSLAKEQITHVIRLNSAQLEYCYKSQLTQNPTLAGKILVKWVIGGDGSVQSSRVIETTMNNKRVENCITRRIVRWRFPAPQDGGVVRVNYPFIFRVTG